MPGIPAWGIEGGELQADPSVVYGQLENGMRYALKRNTQPVGEASMRLMIEVGMRDEADAEEGAAHFVEHMAFNGSTNIPEGELIPMLERLGLSFGADTNAETLPQHTMYKLDLPSVEDETVDTSLMILREIAGELTMAPEAVARERGILISEYQVRNTQGLRRHLGVVDDIMSDSRIAERGVAEPDKFEGISAETLRGFYHGYYRPDRATLVIVGDFDPAEMATRLAARFSDWDGTGEARERYVPGPAEIDGMKIATFSDPATPYLADLQRALPYSQPENTVAEFREQLLDILAARAINLRLAQLAKAENPSSLGGQATAQSLYDSVRTYGLYTLAIENRWEDALRDAEQQWRRAALYGFTQSELDDGLSALKSVFETGAAQSASARSSAIANELAIGSTQNAVRQSPEQTLALYQAVAPTITPELVHENFLAKWGDAPAYAQIASPAPLDQAEQAIAQVLEDSAAVALAKPEETVTAEFAYTDFGTRGTVVSDTRLDYFGIRAVRFANGVNLNLRKTDLEAGKIAVQVEVGSGMSALDTAPSGIQLLAQVIAGADDFGKHTSEEMQRILAGRQVGFGYNIGQQAIFMAASTTPGDLEMQMQLFAAQVTDTAFSEQAQRQYAGIAPIIATNLKADPLQRFSVGYPSILAGDDARFGLLDPQDLVDLSMADLKTIVGTQFASGAIDIALVGDIDEESAIAIVASTFGALDRPELASAEPAKVTFREDRGVRTIYHAGQADQGMISLSWPTDDNEDLKSTLTRELLSSLIGLRANEVLREELGATYTPNALSSASPVYEGYGHLTLFAPATPETMDQVSGAIRALMAEFVDAAPGEDAILRARQPILASYERSEGTNAAWAGVVADAQKKPVTLERRKNRADVLRSVTAADIRASAVQFLTGEPVEIRVIPQAEEEGGD